MDPADADESRRALAALEQAAGRDIDAAFGPGAARGGRRLGDSIVGAGAGWYLRYLGQHVTALGAATAELGRMLAARADSLAAATASLHAEVGALRRDIERLERR